MLERILCLIIGYVFGLFQTSYIYGKLKGIDIRAHGSGNAGATNALRTLGAKAGVISFFGDALKCVFAMTAVRLIFAGSHGDILPVLAMYAGTGVILGHNFPFYLNFRGGKGIAATGGLMFATNLVLTLICAVLFATVFLTTHYVSLGSLLVYLALVIQLVYFGQTGFFEGMAQPALTEMYIVAFCLMAMAYWRHRSNIKKLLTGTERKTYISKKNKVD